MKGKRPPKDLFEGRKAAALKALKEYQKQGSLRENHEAIVDVLLDESDRGAVILVGSLCEDLLADRIIARMPNGAAQREELLRLGGVLNSFQDKLTMGLAFGLIDQETVDSLDIIRQMRNACAHSRMEIKLSTPQLNEVFALLISDDTADNIRGEQSDDYLRLTFAFIAMFHFYRVLGRTEAEAQAVVDELVAKTREYIAEMEARRAASQETPPEQSGPDDHPHQKD